MVKPYLEQIFCREDEAFHMIAFVLEKNLVNNLIFMEKQEKRHSV